MKGKKEKTFLTWEEVEVLCDTLAQKIKKLPPFDYYLVVSRGGLVPGTLLAHQLHKKRILTISVQNYEKIGRKRLRNALILEAPAETLLSGKRILVIDDVWDTGLSLALVRKYIQRAGGICTIVTLHYKPIQSKVPGRPRFIGASTNEWIVYPWEEESLIRRRKQRAMANKKARKLKRAA